MIALLSTIFGVIASVIPSIVTIFQKKLDYAHELELTKIKMDAAREGIVLQLQVEGLKSDIAEGESIRSHDIDIEYTGFWGALRASIRPTITYAFFFLFCGIKIAAFYVLIDKGASPTELLALVWDTETMAIFTAIMGFWFGSRAIEKFNSVYNNGSMVALGSAGGISTGALTTASAMTTKPTEPVKKAVKAKRPAGTGTRDK